MKKNEIATLLELGVSLDGVAARMIQKVSERGRPIESNEIITLAALRGLSLDDIADKMGVSSRTIYNKLQQKNKKGSFTDREIEKLSEILKVSPRLFVGGKKNV